MPELKKCVGLCKFLARFSWYTFLILGIFNTMLNNLQSRPKYNWSPKDTVSDFVQANWDHVQEMFERHIEWKGISPCTDWSEFEDFVISTDSRARETMENQYSDYLDANM